MVTAWWIDFVKIWKIGQKFGRSPDPKTDACSEFICHSDEICTNHRRGVLLAASKARGAKASSVVQLPNTRVIHKKSDGNSDEKCRKKT